MKLSSPVIFDKDGSVINPSQINSAESSTEVGANSENNEKNVSSPEENIDNKEVQIYNSNFLLHSLSS